MFYDNGLLFSCKRCSYCCSSEPGYVFLTSEDAVKISKYLDLTIENFLKTCCRKVDSPDGYRISLRERDDYSCIFLTSSGCMIHSVRPIQCSSYPFWDSILSSEEAWLEESEKCPGIGSGKLFSGPEIEKIIEEKKSKELMVIPRD